MTLDVVANAGPTVARRSLFGVLSADGAGGVTLVSAPAGSGKTVLLRSWASDAGIAERTAWVTVERGERDPQQFWRAVVDQLRSVAGAGALVEEVVPAPEFAGRAFVDRLVAELATLRRPVVIVIDDLHELESPEALAQLEALLARRPGSLRIVLATRHEPSLGLHRLRLAGELIEIRASDLRFTLDEARELLAATGIALSEHALALLHARTEGWAAGLRLAALALAGHPEPERFVSEFSGSERTVAEYLFVEVLERQPPEARHLLLRTSLLARVSGELADALTGASGAEHLLQGLERANAFVVAVDAGRTWFRYHRLFADLLRLELRRTDSGAVAGLHRAAAEWWARHGDVVEAVRHFQAAEDWGPAIRLLGDHLVRLRYSGRSATLDALVAAFPTTAHGDPELAVLVARATLLRGDFEGAAARLAAAERGRDSVPEARRPGFDVRVALVRMALERLRGDFDAALAQREPLGRALKARPGADGAPDHEATAVALLNLGIAEIWSSQRADAEAHLLRALELARRTGSPYLEVEALSQLALAAMTRSIAVAGERALEAIALAKEQGWTDPLVVGVAPVVLGACRVLQGRFEEARRWLDHGARAGRPDVDLPTGVLLQLARGMLAVAERRHEDAVDALRAGVALQARLAAPHSICFQVRGVLAQTLLQTGDPDAAGRTLDEVPDEDRGRPELRTASAVRHLAEGRARAALEILAPVLEDTGHVSMNVTVHALLLDAVARDAVGDTHGAEASMQRALARAESGGPVWPFVVTPARELLERHAGTAHATLVGHILDLLAGAAPAERADGAGRLRHSLSDGELRVLRYLPSNLSAAEIGRELFVSVNTVKTHMRRIYMKLGVHQRSKAVERGRELGLLAPGSHR